MCYILDFCLDKIASVDKSVHDTNGAPYVLVEIYSVIAANASLEEISACLAAVDSVVPT